MPNLNELLQQLDRNPENWDLRLAAIEQFVSSGHLNQARGLVRDSPDGPVPYHVQKRLWDVLSGESDVRVIEEGSADKKPLLVAKAKVIKKGDSAEGPPVLRKAEKEPTAVDNSPPELKRSGETSLRPEDGKPLDLSKLAQGPGKTPEAVSAFRIEAFEDGEVPKPSKRRGGSTASAITLSLLGHMIALLMFMFVAVRVPSAFAPRLIAIPMTQVEEEKVEKKKIIRKIENSVPAAPSMSTTTMLLADSPSPISMPKLETMSMTTNANILDMGFGDSMGMSFEGQGVESAVSFFGIEGGGRRIAFIVDASPTMLLDEKGGMFSYNKVKNEIAVMLSKLNRGTSFNIIVYQGSKLHMFRESPVQAMKLNVHRAKEWLDPINQDINQLGLSRVVTKGDIREGALPIKKPDIAHYSKAIQAALEQDVQAVFCISSGWGSMRRGLSPEDQEVWDKAQAEHREKVAQLNIETTYDPREEAAWKRAIEKARAWLEKENQARMEKGMAPKVVLNFGELVRKISPGAKPPTGTRSEEPPPGPRMQDFGIESQPPYNEEDVETHIRNVVLANFGKNKPDQPQIHMVLFLGKEEDIGDYEKHFVNLTRRNRGELRLLRGYTALENVTKS